MATPLQKAKCALWFNKTKCVKRVQGRCRMISGVDPTSKPFIYAFNKQFFEEDICVKVKYPLLQNVRIEGEWEVPT